LSIDEKIRGVSVGMSFKDEEKLEWLLLVGIYLFVDIEEVGIKVFIG
jgi:hypothetical protein